MKLLAVAGVHGRYSAVTEILGRAGPVDGLAVAGDISHSGTTVEVAQAIQGRTPLAPRLFAVAGNMDSPAIDLDHATCQARLF